MKLLHHSLLLLLAAAADGFSPPHVTSRPSLKLHVQQAAQTSSAKTETELEKQQRHKKNQKRWGRKHKFSAKKTRPFYDLSLDELKALTEYQLGLQIEGVSEAGDDTDESQDENEMSSNQIHEISKLIASWSKLASAGYITRETGDESDVIMLTKKDKVMAAEMAEMCLRHLVDYEKISKVSVSMDLYHSVSSTCLQLVSLARQIIYSYDTNN